MFSRRLVFRFIFVFALIGGCAPLRIEAASGCVWKVSGPNGGTLFLGGSIHALRSTDYPLPSGYSRAFDAANRLAFEVDDKALAESSKGLSKAGEYPRGDSLKNHVDPRTYNYLRRLFGLMGVSEEKFLKFRPWYLALLLESPSLYGRSEELGVEEFLMRRARANSKPMSGLESVREHMSIFSGLTDRQSEAYLLLLFIPAGEDANGARMMEAWRHGDADKIARGFHESFKDFPSLAERLLGVRNRNWIPKIEGYLRSGQTYFVIAGAAHMGGPDGVLSLLRTRGCKIEPL
jgi:uncharacterized protein YbaP (TraB family)